MKKHLKLKIFGNVHGVYYRSSAKEKAEELGIFGFAKNIEDGTVEIEAEGEEDDLQKFLEWCKKGPEIAEVEKVESDFSEEIKNYKSFKIAYS